MFALNTIAIVSECQYCNKMFPCTGIYYIDLFFGIDCVFKNLLRQVNYCDIIGIHMFLNER